MKRSQILASDRRKIASRGRVALFAAVSAVVSALPGLMNLGLGAVLAATPTRSTTIALTPDETRLVVVNREANSVSVIQVKNNVGKDFYHKIAEIPVGEEPRCVAVHPSNRAAYVANAISGTVSVVDLSHYLIVAELKVGTEPRGCALTPAGDFLYVANHTEGTVSIISTSNPLKPILFGAVHVGGRPWAIAITENRFKTDTVFVTDAFAHLNPTFSDPKFDGNGEGRDLAVCRTGVYRTVG
jgi:YVTN family beta-propeller protein